MSIDEHWEEPSLVGTKLADRYRVLEQIEPGVYAAEDRDGTRVRVAVADRSPATEQRLAKVAAAGHPGLAAVIEIGKLDSGDVFVTTEAPRGTSLVALTRDRPIDQRRALAIARQVLQTLGALHGHGIVHGDIKPSSIIVTLDGTERVQLLDAGIATTTRDARYAAPEQALGKADARADLYALGAVVFELLAGRAPFHGVDADTLRRLHAYAPTQTLQQVAPDRTFTPALEQLVATALAKKPAARFASANDMIVAVDAAADSVPVEAAPPPRRTPHDSLLELAPVARQPPPPPAIVPENLSRHVPLPWWTRALKGLQRFVARIWSRLHTEPSRHS